MSATTKRGAASRPRPDAPSVVEFDRDDWDSLKGHQQAIIGDSELADALFDDKRQAFELGWYLGSMQKAEAERQSASAQTWTPEMLYEKDPGHRRVMALEMFAWTILKMENFTTKAEADAFRDELMNTRARHWGRHPWSYAAKGNDAFLNHLRNMGDVFANATPPDVEYPNRKRQPFGEDAS